MNKLEIMYELVKAGYTRSEINKMLEEAEPTPAPTEKTIETTPTEKTIETTPTAEKVTPMVTISEEQLKQILQSVNVAGASVDVPKEKTATDILTKMLGGEK